MFIAEIVLLTGFGQDRAIMESRTHSPFEDCLTVYATFPAGKGEEYLKSQFPNALLRVIDLRKK